MYLQAPAETSCCPCCCFRNKAVSLLHVEDSQC